MNTVKMQNNHSMKKIAKKMYHMRYNYLFILPFMAFLMVFKYAPMYGVTLAFKDFMILKGIMGSPWVGFKYFEQLFTSFSFFEVLWNTVIISLMKLIFCFPMGVIMALFINEIGNERVKKSFQTISYLPHFISWVIAASLITDVLRLEGPVNQIITLFGGEPIYFLAEENWFRWILIFTNIWKTCGWNSIVYIAAITGIDQDLYEAADIDGASRFQKIWHITLPSIRPTILTLFILQIGGLMSAGFDQIYNLYSPIVYGVGDVLDTYTYRKGIVEQNYSYATAAGLFQNVVGFILVVLSNYVVNKLSEGEEGLW